MMASVRCDGPPSPAASSSGEMGVARTRFSAAANSASARWRAYQRTK